MLQELKCYLTYLQNEEWVSLDAIAVATPEPLLPTTPFATLPPLILFDGVWVLWYEKQLQNFW